LAQAFIDANCNGIPDAHLIYVGSGQLEHELKVLTKDAKNIHLVGFKNQSEMPIWYRVGNVLCLVSTTETWGLAVNEAMACGCSAIVSDLVGCGEDLVAPFSPSSVLSFEDVSSWSAAMDHAAAHSNKNRSHLKPQAQIRAFSYSSILSSIQSQFHDE